MRSARRWFLAVCSVLTVLPVFAQLSVMDPMKVGSKPAYIDEATIVVEPRGGFVHESIYLEYGDHLQFAGNGNLEITHQFELPAGSAVNDLWLWIGNNVMRGTMFDAWTGRHIYDSIVTRKIDPAYLSKNGSRYDLKVYPLVSGSKRKVKLAVIAPTRWVGGTASAELPLALLKGSAAATKPVRVLFKTLTPIWGTPRINELLGLEAKSAFDSAGFHYTFFQVKDVSSLTSFSIAFSVGFPNAMYAPGIERKGDTTYYQVGVDPAGWGIRYKDSTMRSVAVGLDFSGTALNGLTTALTRIRTSVHRLVRPIDRFKLFAARRDTIGSFGTWCRGDSVAIDSAFAAFAGSSFVAGMTQTRGLKIVFCDQSAVDLWSFPGLDSLARVSKYANIVDAAAHFADADVVASYRHGNEDSYMQKLNLTYLLGKVDSLLMRGGRFLGFFDYNRPGQEQIITHYIPDLTTNMWGSYPSATLFRAPGGTLASQFLPSYTTGSVNLFVYSAEGVVKELVDASNRPAVISKPVYRGLLVTSGLWTFSQSLDVRKSLATALLGVGAQGPPGGSQKLRPLLTAVQNAVKADSVDDVLVISNGDSVTSVTDATSWAAAHVAAYGTTPPVFTTINLLDGSLYTPGILAVDGVEYYGGGYALQALAMASRGQHFETHIRDWAYIQSAMTYSSIPPLDSLLVTVTPVGGTGSASIPTEIDPQPGNTSKPRFYVGTATGSGQVKFDAYARFAHSTQTLHREATAFGVVDTSVAHILPAMIGWDRLQKMFITSSTDTARIVSWAMSYNLLCDYTSILCLEPDAQHRPLVNPLDESKFVTHVWDNLAGVDTLVCGAYPNPFNGQTTIAVRLPRVADVAVVIYNMLGQRVREVSADAVSGVYTTTWNATNERGVPVASGVYIVQVSVRDHATGKQDTRLLRVMLLK